MRRLTALVGILALAACFGRAGAWASLGAEAAHACCDVGGEKPAPAMSQCCPAGALSSVRLPDAPSRAPLSSIPVPAPAVSPSSLLALAPSAPSSDGHSAPFPARGPPLA